MKIGILTFHWAFNYGAVLQAYALLQVLKNLGHDVEVIDYRPCWARECLPFRMPHRLGEAINLLDKSFKSITFKRFNNEYLKLSHKKYHFGEKITGYDCIIVGSDQVFNPDIIYRENRLDTTYLLKTVSEETKKISYAASFGNSTLDEKFRSKFKNLLSSFSAISIREKSGKEIVESFGFNAEVVPDPTILLGDFSSLLKNNQVPTENYVLNFIFQRTDIVCKVKNIIQSESHLPVKDIVSLRDKFVFQGGLYNLSPPNWINTIRNAKFVITDSFHATVFCILMHRPFVSLILNAWGGDWSERIRCLLTELGLQDRLLSSFSKETVRSLYYKDINWDKIDLKLLEQREKGLYFLGNVIS